MVIDEKLQAYKEQRRLRKEEAERAKLERSEAPIVHADADKQARFLSLLAEKRKIDQARIAARARKRLRDEQEAREKLSDINSQVSNEASFAYNITESSNGHTTTTTNNNNNSNNTTNNSHNTKLSIIKEDSSPSSKMILDEKCKASPVMIHAEKDDSFYMSEGEADKWLNFGSVAEKKRQNIPLASNYNHHHLTYNSDESPPQRIHKNHRRRRREKESSTTKSITFQSKYSYEDDCDSDEEVSSLSTQKAKSQDVLKPEFQEESVEFLGPLEPLVLSDTDNKLIQIPASVNRYLAPYQKDGVRFLYSHISKGRGALLGDDMGLGKTVMIVSLLAALLEKTGTDYDAIVLRDRIDKIRRYQSNRRRRNDKGYLFLSSSNKCRSYDSSGSSEDELLQPPALCVYAPILIIVPASVRQNWLKESRAWGHFSAELYDGATSSDVLSRCKSGEIEILICSKDTFKRRNNSYDDFDEISKVRWKLIVADEFHDFKNEKTNAWKALQELSSNLKVPVVGLTGTAMPNRHQELWNLSRIVQPGLLGEWESFRDEIDRPILEGRKKSASAEVKAKGAEKQVELDKLIDKFFQRRLKTEVLKDKLTKKDEYIIFCELSDLQKELYCHILDLPDYQFLQRLDKPCDCKRNTNFYSNLYSFRTESDKRRYWRQEATNKNIVWGGKCCYNTPYLDPYNKELGINPDAVLWRAQHPHDASCGACPGCAFFAALSILHKVACHPTLLQVESNPLKQTGQWQKYHDFAKLAFPRDILMQMPGKDIYKQVSVMDDHVYLSGKMSALDRYLKRFSTQRDRVLVFSYSTTTLDLIEKYAIRQGYTFLRLDGKTPERKRQALVDRYQKDDSTFLFLISTKAGGQGLNLTAANKVVIFDVSWNPSIDEQAQDRAFRIGQEKDVEVVRLVAKGTIEENMYWRQLYKKSLSRRTLDKNHIYDRQMFNSIEGSKYDQGELFGRLNMLMLKNSHFCVGVADIVDHEGKVKESDLIEPLQRTLRRERKQDEDDASFNAVNESGDEYTMLQGQAFTRTIAKGKDARDVVDLTRPSDSKLIAKTNNEKTKNSMAEKGESVSTKIFIPLPTKGNNMSNSRIQESHSNDSETESGVPTPTINQNKGGSIKKQKKQFGTFSSSAKFANLFKNY